MLNYDELLKLRADAEIWVSTMEDFLKEADHTSKNPIDRTLSYWSLIKMPATHCANLSFMLFTIQEKIDILQRKKLVDSAKSDLTKAKKNTSSSLAASIAQSDHETLQAMKKQKLSDLDELVTVAEKYASVALQDKHRDLERRRTELRDQITNDLVLHEAHMKTRKQRAKEAETAHYDKQESSKEDAKCESMANEILKALQSAAKSCKESILRTKSVFFYLLGELVVQVQDYPIEELADLSTLTCLTALKAPECLFDGVALTFSIDKMPDKYLAHAQSTINALSLGRLNVVPGKKFELRIQPQGKISFHDVAAVPCIETFYYS